MKVIFKFSVFSILMISASTALGYFLWYKPKFEKGDPGTAFGDKIKKGNIFTKIQSKANILKEYAKMHGYNTSVCFMVDMHISSGKPRFFVYNLIKDSIERAGLVAHGSGSDKGNNDLYFSNEPNSNCTSLGNYKIGKSYYGKFGLAYKLHGLDQSNSKAFERFVVLHAHECVPNEEVSPLEICESWGCPTVAPAFLVVLKKYIDKSDKAILMNIYY